MLKCRRLQGMYLLHRTHSNYNDPRNATVIDTKHKQGMLAQETRKIKTSLAAVSKAKSAKNNFSN